MRLEEIFIPGKSLELGAQTFRFSESREQIMTPHKEMETCEDIIENNNVVNSGLDQLSTFLTGKSFSFDSDFNNTQEYFNEWLRLRPKFKEQIKLGFFVLFGTGNLFIEKIYKEDSSVPNFFNVISDSSRVYYNPNPKNDNEYWLFKVPMVYRSKEMPARHYRISYRRGTHLIDETIMAIPVHKKKIAHLKIGWSRDGLYGRSNIASAEAEAEAMKDIVDNFSKIAKYRSIGKKIISLGSDALPASQSDVDRLKEEMDVTEDVEHILINKQVNMNPLSYTGEVNTMTSELDEARKILLMGLIPNFLTPWNSEVNRATSEDVKVMFSLNLEYYRSLMEEFITSEILSPIAESVPFLDKKVKLKIVASDLYSLEDKTTIGMNLFQNNAITLNELRTQYCNMQPVHNGDLFAKDMTEPFANPRDVAKADAIEENPEIIDRGKEFFFKESTPEPTEQNPIIDVEEDLGKELKKIMKDLGNEVINNADKHMVKKEAKTINGKAVDSLDNVFSGFLTKINSAIKRAFSKAFNKEIQLKATNKKTKNVLQKNADYLKQNAYNQAKTHVLKKKQAIRRILSQGVAAGKNSGVIKQELKDELKKNDYEVDRIVRTELMSSLSIQKLRMWKEMGYKWFQWITTIDERTCPQCRPRHMKIYSIDEALNGKIPIPGAIHVNCRCFPRLNTSKESFKQKILNRIENLLPRRRI